MATAKIQYTIQLENLPSEVKNTLIKLASKADRVSDLLQSFAEKEFDAIKLAKDLEVARQELALLDANLDDCYSILSGYARYEAQQLELTKIKKQEFQENEPSRGN